jgi:hypothetical protein
LARGASLGRTHDIRGARKAVAIAAAAFSVWLADVPRANACGGCFHQVTVMDPQQKESTVVTDHRMAFSISKQRTVLWDQIRYQGNPSEFVWALPVKPGTVVELSSDQWMGALDALTQPTILSPPRYSTVDYGGGGGGACASSSGDSAEAADQDGGAVVQVVNEAVVGPYETVTLHSSNPNALEDWLVSHGYAITSAARPVVASYVNEGFDFIALRLRPNESVSAMQPVRVISPGADVSLPLRMVAVGAGASVGITLFVVSEGRYQPQNFPNAEIDFSNLTWDFNQGLSNYQELSAAAMAQSNGRSFITEYAQPASIAPSNVYPQTSSAGTLPGLYYGSCGGDVPSGDVHTTMMNDADASMNDSDASAPDADGSAGDAAPTGSGASNGGGGGSSVGSCSQLDDLVVATDGMDPGSVWVTRLRANLPVDALAQDLKLEAASPQTPVTNQHTAKDPTAPAASIAPPSRRNNAGSFLIVLGTACILAMRFRRREPRV